MKTIVQLVPTSASGRRPGLKLVPLYITIHSTGNAESTAKNEADNICNNNPDKQSSFHLVIGEKEAYNVIPFREVAWHAGDGYEGTGNRSSLAIEMVETGNREKVLRNTIDNVAQLMQTYKIPLDRVVPHQRWSKKACPRILLDKELIQGGMNWEWFLSELQKKVMPDKNQSWKWAQEQGLFSQKKQTDPVSYDELAFALYQMQGKGVK